MSDCVPSLRVTQRVRMMATTLAQKTGLANQRGTVVEVFPKQEAMVDFGRFGQIRCHASELMPLSAQEDADFGPPNPPRPERRREYA